MEWIMKSEYLNILEFNGEGYKPLVDFSSWRVAFLRFIDELIPENIQRLERHVETDEVFVLLKGQAILFIGEGEEKIDKLLEALDDCQDVEEVFTNANYID